MIKLDHQRSELITGYIYSALYCSALYSTSWSRSGWPGGCSGGRTAASGRADHIRGCPGLVAVRGGVPALACLAGRMRPGLCSSAAHQSTPRRTRREHRRAACSDQASRRQEYFFQRLEPPTPRIKSLSGASSSEFTGVHIACQIARAYPYESDRTAMNCNPNCNPAVLMITFYRMAP